MNYLKFFDYADYTSQCIVQMAQMRDVLLKSSALSEALTAQKEWMDGHLKELDSTSQSIYNKEVSAFDAEISHQVKSH